MQVLVRDHTHQRASQAYDAQILAIKLTHEAQNYRGHTSSIAERYRSPRRPKKRMPHSSRAGEGSRRVRILSIMLSYFSFAFTVPTAKHGLQFSTERRGDKHDAFAPE